MYRIYFSLFFILFLGFLLSSRMILAGDFFYLADQARDYLLAKDIIFNNHIQLIGTHSGLGGFFHGPLWLYMLVPVYLLGNGNPIVFAYFYIILALITIGVGYVVGSKLYNHWVGLLVAFVLAISPSIWEYVLNTIGINVVPLVYLGIYYFFIKFIRGDDRSLIFASFFVGTTLQFETAAALVLIPVFGISVLLFRFDVIRNIRVVLLSLLSFVVSISWYILFDLKHQFLMTKALVGLFYSDGDKNGYLYFPERFFSHMKSLHGAVTSVVFDQSLILLIILSAVLVYGMWLLFDKRQYRKEFLALFFIPIAIFMIFMAYPYPIYHDYVLGFTIPFALAVGLLSFLLWKTVWGKGLVLLFIVINVVYAVSFIYNQYSNYQSNNTAGSYKNQLSVVEWILRDSQGKDFGYFVYTPEVYTYGMDYLLSWKTQGNEYIPDSAKKPITYLILYPSLQNDTSAHQFWKDNVVRTTSPVIVRKEFRGDIIVEKLRINPGEQPADPNYNQQLIFR